MFRGPHWTSHIKQVLKISTLLNVFDKLRKSSVGNWCLLVLLDAGPEFAPVMEGIRTQGYPVWHDWHKRQSITTDLHSWSTKLQMHKT